MRTIALKASANKQVQQYAHAVARQLGARLIVVDCVHSLPADGIDLLMWPKDGEDSGQLKELQKTFPRLVQLDDAAGGRRQGEQSGMVLPPDPEDGAMVLSYSSWARRHGIDPHFWLR